MSLREVYSLASNLKCSTCPNNPGDTICKKMDEEASQKNNTRKSKVLEEDQE